MINLPPVGDGSSGQGPTGATVVVRAAAGRGTRTLWSRPTVILCLAAVAIALVAWYAWRSRDSLRVERIDDDFAYEVLGIKDRPLQYRYTGGKVDCWLEETADGRRTVLARFGLANQFSAFAASGELEYGLILLRPVPAGPGEQAWELWHRQYRGGGEYSSSEKPAHLVTVKLPKWKVGYYAGASEYKHVDREPATLWGFSGEDERGKPWHLALRCGPDR